MSTKQSRKTAARKARQAIAWERFKAAQTSPQALRQIALAEKAARPGESAIFGLSEAAKRVIIEAFAPRR